MFQLLLIFLAGGCGCLLRYGVAGWVQRSSGGTFPFGTMTVNILGCILIGFLATLFTGPFLVREEYRLAIFIGLLGGFTTFSSFGFEAVTLLNDGQLFYATMYVLGSNLFGLLAAWGGMRLAAAIYGAA